MFEWLPIEASRLYLFLGASLAVLLTPAMAVLYIVSNSLDKGPLAGIVVGGAGAWLLDGAVKKEWITESYEGAAILGIALLAYSGAELIGGNGFIAAFVSGLVFGTFVRGRCGFVFEFAEAKGQLLVLLISASDFCTKSPM